jgi:(S)-ureidoglycine aminohydrolase
MNDLFGGSRDALRDRYAVRTPGSLVPSCLPGWEKAQCHVLIAPAMGARFSELLIVLENDGQCMGNTGTNQYFIYLLDGAASILLDDRRHRLEPGSCIYLPPSKDVQIKSAGAATRILIFQKPYQALRGVARPPAFVSHEREAKPRPLPGNDGGRVQALLPEDPAFDMGIEILSFEPGAGPAGVTAQVMEIGLTMLQGRGLFRLGTEWHPVQAGDVIWVAPFCPQWFVAVGKSPASYICYQDTNRDPM